MQGLRIIVSGLFLCLWGSPIAWAGLYSTEEPPRVKGQTLPPARGVQFMPPDRFATLYLLEMNQLANPRMATDELKEYWKKLPAAKSNQQQKELLEKLKPDLRPLAQYYGLWEAYNRRKEDLSRKQRQGRLTIDDRINLSFYLLRLGQSPEEVLALLKTPEAQAARHFMVYANLATAYERLAAGAVTPRDRIGSLGPAFVYHQQTRRVLDTLKEWPGWTAERLAWYRQAEEQQEKLVRLRLREARLPTFLVRKGKPRCKNFQSESFWV